MRGPALVLLFAALAGCVDETVSPVLEVDPTEEWAGGEATVFADDADAFTHAVPTLDREGERTFFKGRALFRDQWVAAPASTDSRDGLGPLFNARACDTCHVRDGRGRPPEPGEPMVLMFVRLSIPGGSDDGAAVAEPTYGDQLQPFGIEGVPAEGTVLVHYDTTEGTYGDGEGYELRRPRYELTDLAYGPLHPEVRITARVPRQMIGLGLLAAIDEDSIVGGGGVANRVWDEEAGVEALGRFGWKATQPTVKQQSALAFLHDLGMTTSLYREQPCTSAEQACATAVDGGTPEVLDVFLDDVAFYCLTLAVPARRDHTDPEVLAGKAFFHEAGCANCHVPKHVTGELPAVPQLSHQTIYPYTDMLLHDMGEGLADERQEYDAQGQDWRTAPLWGIGLVQTVNDHELFLHDGRARGFAEAILWHDGEAEPARERFRTASRKERDALLRFLGSL